MDLVKDFNFHGVSALKNFLDCSAVMRSKLLQRDWRETADVVNQQQKAVFVFGEQGLDVIAVPASLSYEHRRKLPITRYTDPLFHLPVAEFKSALKSGSIKDYFANESSVLVVDRHGKPVMSVVDRTAVASLVLDSSERITFRGMENILFTDAPPYEESGGYIPNTFRAVASEKAKLDRAIEALDRAQQNRDAMHEAIMNLRFES